MSNNIERNDIKQVVQHYHKKLKSDDDRYASYDYCFNYFKMQDISKDLEKSCLALGFYLASWGMYRGSSFLLQKSVKHLESTIKYIASLDKSCWDIDIDKYTDNGNIEKILDIYDSINKRIIPKNCKHLTLITKVMLGVFGCIPAYDNYFIKSFKSIFKNECGFSVVNKKSLICIYDFYMANQKLINNMSILTIDFRTGSKTQNNYTKAKIIDMYGFSLSLEKNE